MRTTPLRSTRTWTLLLGLSTLSARAGIADKTAFLGLGWRAGLGMVLAACVASGCALSHRLDGHVDGAAPADGAAAPEAGLSDAAVPPPDVPTGPWVECGPNVCRAGEICCNAECGICAFPDECVDHGCPDP